MKYIMRGKNYMKQVLLPLNSNNYIGYCFYVYIIIVHSSYF